jgi:hypothetical protein
MNHGRIFRTLVFIIAGAVAGCLRETIIGVTDAATGAPVVGLLIERFRLFDANGTPYNPLPLFESKITDLNGAVGFGNVGNADRFQMERHSPNGLLVKLGRKEFRIDPKPDHAGKKGWGCSVWLEMSGWKYSTWPERVALLHCVYVTSPLTFPPH